MFWCLVLLWYSLEERENGRSKKRWKIFCQKNIAVYADPGFGSSDAGSIFMDYRMASDFSSPYSIIYGHNVRDGSMLSDLVQLKDQILYDEEPYFWILTPDGNYRYQIFSIFQCHRTADVFQRDFERWGRDFTDWEKELKSRNSMQGDVQLEEDDHVIAFSTCVPNSFDRTIVCGKYLDGDKIPDPHSDSADEN